MTNLAKGSPSRIAPIFQLTLSSKEKEATGRCPQDGPFV